MSGFHDGSNTLSLHAPLNVKSFVDILPALASLSEIALDGVVRTYRFVENTAYYVLMCSHVLMALFSRSLSLYARQAYTAAVAHQLRDD